jgi:hypothetical protein
MTASCCFDDDDAPEPPVADFKATRSVAFKACGAVRVVVMKEETANQSVFAGDAIPLKIEMN